MNFIEAVNACTAQHRVRRPWKHNAEGKHVFATHDGRLRFAHSHDHFKEQTWPPGGNPMNGDVRVVDLTSDFIPYIADILATDWEIVPGEFGGEY